MTITRAQEVAVLFVRAIKGLDNTVALDDVVDGEILPEIKRDVAELSRMFEGFELFMPTQDEVDHELLSPSWARVVFVEYRGKGDVELVDKGEGRPARAVFLWWRADLNDWRVRVVGRPSTPVTDLPQGAGPP